MKPRKPVPKYESIGIEIFAAAKSCDQGCPPCPLANKGNPITATVVNADVQQTFSLLESALKNANSRYDLHLSSTFDLIPVLNHPDIINMARFTTNKLIRLEGNAEKFANDIKNTLDKYKIDPKVIGYSIVPALPAISETEAGIIRQINGAISEWYFTSQHREIEVTIRSNLIKSALYDQIIPNVFATDTQLVKGLVEEFATGSKQTMSVNESVDSRMYYNAYKGKYKKRKVSIINRVITNKQVVGNPKFNIAQAMGLYPFSPYSVQDYAIAPKGVMLMHSSLAINSPILWVTHKDFRDSLQLELESGKKFSSLRFLRKLMMENNMMYRVFVGEARDKGNDLKSINFMQSYEGSRLAIRQRLKEMK